MALLYTYVTDHNNLINSNNNNNNITSTKISNKHLCTNKPTMLIQVRRDVA